MPCQTPRFWAIYGESIRVFTIARSPVHSLPLTYVVVRIFRIYFSAAHCSSSSSTTQQAPYQRHFPYTCQVCCFPEPRARLIVVFSRLSAISLYPIILFLMFLEQLVGIYSLSFLDCVELEASLRHVCWLFSRTITVSLLHLFDCEFSASLILIHTAVYCQGAQSFCCGFISS